MADNDDMQGVICNAREKIMEIVHDFETGNPFWEKSGHTTLEQVVPQESSVQIKKKITAVHKAWQDLQFALIDLNESLGEIEDDN